MASAKPPIPREQRGEATNAVARDLGMATVGVDQAHARAGGRRPVENQAIRAEPRVALAQASCQLNGVAAFGFDRLCLDVQEVVSVGLGLDDVHA